MRKPFLVLHAATNLYSVVVLQPFGCAKGSGNQSNGTVSSDSTPTDRSRHQHRQSRPHSLVVNWRSPGYASDTLSSMQMKSSHNGCGSTSFVASGGVVCSRFRKSEIIMKSI